MVHKIKCECSDRYEANINSLKLFEEIKDFFQTQVDKNIYVEENPQEPFYVWINGDRKEETFASKWYRCRVCGCLWEFDYPDFPTPGFVKKYENGIYNGTFKVENDIDY